MYRLILDGRVVRYRPPVEGRRARKVRWVVHAADCAYAPGCAPLADLAARLTEPGVLGRLRAGVLARCVSCRPVLVETVPDPAKPVYSPKPRRASDPATTTGAS